MIETFDVPVLMTYADIVTHYNAWAEAEKKQYRLREANGAIEVYDPPEALEPKKETNDPH